MKKLKYEDIRETLILNYRTRRVKMLEEDENGNPYVWGLIILIRSSKTAVIEITTDLLCSLSGYKAIKSAATTNQSLRLLRRMMSLAQRTGKLGHAPYFPMLKEDNVRKGFLTPSQFIKLRGVLPEHLRPLVTFLYFTGCRIGAALAITRTEIEFENGRYQLRIEGNQTKNEDPILLLLPLELNEILKKLPRKGNLFDSRNLRKLQAACIEVGLGRATGP